MTTSPNQPRHGHSTPPEPPTRRTGQAAPFQPGPEPGVYLDAGVAGLGLGLRAAAAVATPAPAGGRRGGRGARAAAAAQLTAGPAAAGGTGGPGRAARGDGVGGVGLYTWQVWDSDIDLSHSKAHALSTASCCLPVDMFTDCQSFIHSFHKE